MYRWLVPLAVVAAVVAADVIPILPAVAATPPADPTGDPGAALFAHLDHLLRATSWEIVAEYERATPLGGRRRLEFTYVALGNERQRLRVTSPQRLAGHAFLRVPAGVWHYDPASGRIARLDLGGGRAPWTHEVIRIMEWLSFPDVVRQYGLAEARCAADDATCTLHLAPQPGAATTCRSVVVTMDRATRQVLGLVCDREADGPLAFRFAEDSEGGYGDVAGRRLPNIVEVRRVAERRPARLTIRRAEPDVPLTPAAFTPLALSDEE